MHMPDPDLGRPSHGIGRVEREWGSWWVCRVCHEELQPTAVSIDSPFGADAYWPKEKRVIDTKCGECGANLMPMQVSGKGTFDVMFPSGEHSVHESLLAPCERAVAA